MNQFEEITSNIEALNIQRKSAEPSTSLFAGKITIVCLPCLFCLLFTGNPKGVMLTHGNVVADFSGFLKVTDVGDPLFSSPVYIMFDDFPQISSRS